MVVKTPQSTSNLGMTYEHPWVPSWTGFLSITKLKLVLLALRIHSFCSYLSNMLAGFHQELCWFNENGLTISHCKDQLSSASDKSNFYIRAYLIIRSHNLMAFKLTRWLRLWDKERKNFPHDFPQRQDKITRFAAVFYNLCSKLLITKKDSSGAVGIFTNATLNY